MAKNITVIPARANRTSLAENLELQKKRVAAYCRVSTDQAEQLSSYEAQVNYYTTYIEGHPDYECAGIFADEGISGTNTKKRLQFNRMIEDCKNGKIDMIITKSISRFARNTLDCLNFVRLLKDLGIGVVFEKENIHPRQQRRSLAFNSQLARARRVTVNLGKFDLGYQKAF